MLCLTQKQIYIDILSALASAVLVAIPAATSSAIHKAGGFTVNGHSTGLPGIIPVEQKSVHRLSMAATAGTTS